jgi:DNA polymerase
VFVEGQVLRQLDHPAIIRLQDCGYADPASRARPYLVMDYFDGVTLEESARKQPLKAEKLLPLARLMAEGLHAAHAKGILHRDVKPANVLVRQEGTAWSVKLIDFGLALRRNTLQSGAVSSKTLQGTSIAGTLDYAAPEQMGKRAGAVGPHSDVYGFARTCCYALFQTPQPLLRHWRSLPAPLAELLESCLEETPENRPATFTSVLAGLSAPAPRSPAPRPETPLPVVPPTSTRALEQLTLEERRRELASLAQRAAVCERCAPLARSRTQTVFGIGPLDAEVFFIGEAPGAEEDRLGQPFVGPAGQLFNRILESCGLKRDEVYIANMLLCRPPGNRTATTGEVGNCREYLDRQLALVRPRVICALGGCAAQNLLGSMQSLGKLRGCFHDYHGTPVLCTYHPAFLLPHRSPEKRKDVWQDMQLLLRHLGRPLPSPARPPLGE